VTNGVTIEKERFFLVICKITEDNEYLDDYLKAGEKIEVDNSVCEYCVRRYP
jgi:hypothetical protein